MLFGLRMRSQPFSALPGRSRGDVPSKCPGVRVERHTVEGRRLSDGALSYRHDGIRIMTEIEESWARVTAWLAANAPASYATLNPPASHAELDACERGLQVALPAELRRLLMVNNGAADFDADGGYHREAAFLPGGHRLLSAAELAGESRSLVEIADSLGEVMIGYWWHPQWVLFGRHIAADGMAIDQRPGPGQGAVGEFMHEDSTEFTMGTSLGEYIAKIANSIENGTDFLYLRPSIEDGALDWDVIT
jgi:cell wall assembly regulator SMI1